jgi:UDP-2,3-diacylglucosamine hydrolase
MVRRNTYFFSDLHLGLPDRERSLLREKLLIKLLDEIKDEAVSIWFVGDIFDFWWEYKHVIPRGYTRFLGKLCELNDSGVELHFFTGNHDVWMKSFFTKDLGIPVHRKELETTISGKSFFIAHGDGLGKGDFGYKLLKKIFTNKFLQWCYSRLHPNFAFGIANLWSKSRRKKEKIYEFKGIDNELLIQYSKEKLKTNSYDYLIFGHRHFPFELMIGENSKYINIGDWLINYTYLFFNGDEMKMYCYKTGKSELYISDPEKKIEVDIF